MKLNFSDLSAEIVTILNLLKRKMLSMLMFVYFLVDWIQPNSWTGPEATLYRSFDTPDQIVLMERTDKSNFAALVPGLVRILSQGI